MNSYYDYKDLKERKPVRWWHETIIDDMLAYPQSSLAERSKRLGYTASYLSIIINSDMFKAYYDERRQMLSLFLDQSIRDKTTRAADKALDIVLETLDKKRDKIPFREISEFTDKTLERLGYGVKQNSSMVNVQINAPQISKEQLAEARRDLRAVEDQRQKEVEPAPSAQVVGLPPDAKENG